MEAANPSSKPVTLFYSYSHKDEALRDELETHLSLLGRQGIIQEWHDRRIGAGQEWADAIDKNLEAADVILLLISADFLVSDYCYDKEMKRALEKHEADEACVIPIIIRAVDWIPAPFSKLQALPRDNKAVTSWQNRDEAWTEVAKGIREEVEKLEAKPVRIALDTAEVKAEKLWNVPHPRNLFFTGREDVLEKLHAALASSGSTASAQPQAISGLGGIGKTQTAVEYVYRYHEEYRAVLWANADSPKTLLSDFVALANLLNLPEKKEQDQSLAVAAIKRWFENNTDWLLILDNADDLTVVRDFIPSEGKGHVLLTTRAQATGEIARRAKIEKMESEEGALFLLRRANLIGNTASLEQASETDRKAASSISREMGGLPLALDQAGAFIEETACGLEGYLDLYRTKGIELLKRRGELATAHLDPVATTWTLSFEKIEDASPAAAELLRFCAFLYPDGIPEELITEGAPELGPVLEPIAADPLGLNQAIAEILKYSLLHRDQSSRTLDIHRLVQTALKTEMDETSQHTWAERAVRAMNLAFPDVEFSTWPRCERLLPHAQVCAGLVEEWELEFQEAARLLNLTGSYLRERARYSEAELLYAQALAIRENVHGPEHPDVATSLNNLAEIYRTQGNYTEAEPLYKRALAIDEKALGPDHPDVGIDLNNLAELYRTQGNYTEAEPLYKRALAISEEALGPHHPRVATNLNNLAELYRTQGNYTEAEPLYKRALAISEEALGPHHPSVAIDLNNLAGLYDTQGNYTKAAPLYKRALAILEQALGPNHPDVATNLNNLAELYQTQGNYTEAAPLYKRALAISEEALGPHHPDVAIRLNNLAALYQTQGNYPEAEPLYKRALAILEQALGPNHPSVATVLKNYAYLLRQLNRKAEADELANRAQAIRAKHAQENPTN